MTEPSEPGDDLVGDVEHVVGAADLQAALVVAGRRNDDPARGENRLGDEAADPVRTDFGNRGLQVRDLRVAPRLETRPVRPQGRIDVRQQVRALGVDVEPALAAFLAGDRGGEPGRAVICLLSGDDDLLVRPPQSVVVEVHETQRGIDRGRAAGGEEHVVQVAGRKGRPASSRAARQVRSRCSRGSGRRAASPVRRWRLPCRGGRSRSACTTSRRGRRSAACPPASRRRCSPARAEMVRSAPSVSHMASHGCR